MKGTLSQKTKALFYEPRQWTWCCSYGLVKKYAEKCLNILQTEQFIKLGHDPTKSIENKLQQLPLRKIFGPELISFRTVYLYY